MNHVVIECAHVAQGAYVKIVLDLGDIAGAPRIVHLCALCYERLRAGIYHELLREVLIANERSGILDHAMRSNQNDGS